MASTHVFPAVRGIQAGREYYVTMCPLRLMAKLFVFDGEELLPEQRAQRQLNKGRVPTLARYVTENPDSYVFSAITASIDGDLRFVPAGESPAMGELHIPHDATFVVNDGQHRRAAIEVALRERRELADETIAVVFFHDRGLGRCQQMFADLNRYAIRPSPSLNVLYDHRDDRSRLSRLVLERLPAISELVERESASLSPGSRRLLTLSAMNKATAQLLNGVEGATRDNLAVDFWSTLFDIFPEWQQVSRGSLASGSVRASYVHSHGVILHALGRAGNTLILRRPDDWESAMRELARVDWRRASPLWEGRAVSGGALTNSSRNVVLCGNLLKKRLGLELSAEEQRQENTMRKVA